MTFKLIDDRRDNTREFETRAAAEEKREEMRSLGADPDDLHIERADAETDGGQAARADTPVDPPEAHETDVIDTSGGGELPDSPPVDEDPLSWVPGHFIDEIQGVPTINRKGYAVIASQYGISVEAESVKLPHETDWEYAAFQATAETPDGETYSGFGSAHVDRDDDKHLLAELAETRAMKRAVAWASGVGMTAAEELMGEMP
jgi:hypothetical protein